jgi:hypothetical protein
MVPGPFAMVMRAFGMIMQMRVIVMNRHDAIIGQFPFFGAIFSAFRVRECFVCLR